MRDLIDMAYFVSSGELYRTKALGMTAGHDVGWMRCRSVILSRSEKLRIVVVLMTGTQNLHTFI